jgi:uncharacterized membrane protein YccC
MGVKAVDVALKQVEQQQERELTTKFSARMKASVRDIGQVDTMRHTILSFVATENYERAIEELHRYCESKSAYPQFSVRSERYSKYAVDLINAVKAKRSFPGLQHLAMSKQQELFDRAMEHFDDLKATLRKIEQIDREVKLEDVRSTVLVVKAMIYSAFAVLVVGFLMEISRGVLPAAFVVLDSGFGDLTNWLFDKIGL